MITHISKLDEARNDTLITKAKGQALDRLSSFYGFDRPLYIKEENWRLALEAVVFGARGTLGILFDFVNKVFKEFSDFTTYEMSSIAVNTIRYSGDADVRNLEGRLCRINGKTHYIASIVNTLGSVTTFRVANVDTSYFKAMPDLTNQTFNVSILPYVIEEYGGEVRLIVDAGLFNIPSHFLKNHNDTIPAGGYILDFFSSNTKERFGDQVAGKYPVYLLDEQFNVRFFDVILNILASGIQLKGETLLWSSGVASLYASLSDLLRTGSVDPDNVVASPART
tara:strand:- start:6830 stop:7672 length:843 start_codon:yes stop_codon:yes gene_type:complete